MLLLLGSLNHRAISVVPGGMQVLWHKVSETQGFLSAAIHQDGEPVLSECAPARFAWALLFLARQWPFLWPPRSPLGSITSSFPDRYSHQESIVHFLENKKPLSVYLGPGFHPEKMISTSGKLIYLSKVSMKS